jgi:2-C-methyl-D-erythritol 4-phosphate cytidylyltransferase / 2-C-methyl-D-erythritol 2,4-cyclodiphosphate synthase
VASSSGADVVVVAAGSSSRMGGIDKVLVPLAGWPLLAWSLRTFADAPFVARLVVVVAPERVDDLRAATWMPDGAVVVAGGARRQESVAAGVAELTRPGADDDRVVLIHDGARPAIRPETADLVRHTAAEFGAAIPIMPVVETLKTVSDGFISGTVDRTGVGAAQTPQAVRLGLLREAWRRFPPGGPDTFTDEAALLEACTIPVRVVPGQPSNLKVTVPSDLDLGGVIFPGAPRLSGHSDGDVVLHAVASALLGAAGMGDLGQTFPADERTPRGIDSGTLLDDVARRIRRAGFRPARIDVTIVAARPPIADRLEEIRRRVAALAGVGSDDVGVKASSGNLAGMEGAGRGISARVIATLEPVAW